jgi:hypothetical protein
VPAASPYILTDQSLQKKIFVKAIDQSGNERIVVLAAQHPLPWYENYLVLGIIMVVILIILFVVIFVNRRICKKSIKSR